MLRGVGIGSSWQALGADFRMTLLMTDWKVQRGMPSDEAATGRAGACRQRIKFLSNFDDFIKKVV